MFTVIFSHFTFFNSKCLVKCESSKFAYHNFCLAKNKQLIGDCINWRELGQRILLWKVSVENLSSFFFFFFLIPKELVYWKDTTFNGLKFNKYLGPCLKMCITFLFVQYKSNIIDNCFFLSLPVKKGQNPHPSNCHIRYLLDIKCILFLLLVYYLHFKQTEIHSVFLIFTEAQRLFNLFQNNKWL